jgi:hypothetical protein
MLPPEGCDGFVYLLQEREFVRSGEPIYTVGRTINMIARFRQYTTGSVFIRCLPCVDHVDAERRLIAGFKCIFVMRREFGYETFEGDCEKMKLAMQDIVWAKNLDVRTTTDMLPIKARSLCAETAKMFGRVMEHEEVRRLFLASVVDGRSFEAFVEQANPVLGFNIVEPLSSVFADVFTHVPALLDLLCPDWRVKVSEGNKVEVQREVAIDALATWIGALGPDAHDRLLKNTGIWRKDRAAAAVLERLGGDTGEEGEDAPGDSEDAAESQLVDGTTRKSNTKASTMGAAVGRLLGVAFGMTVRGKVGARHDRWRIDYTM